jgi:hypothetical protein
MAAERRSAPVGAPKASRTSCVPVRVRACGVSGQEKFWGHRALAVSGLVGSGVDGSGSFCGSTGQTSSPDMRPPMGLVMEMMGCSSSEISTRRGLASLSAFL